MTMLLDTAVAVGAGATYTIQTHERSALVSGQVPVQAYIGGTATVTVEGRCDPSMEWHVITTFSASGAELVALMPEMRANVTSWTSADVSVALGLAS